MRVTAKELEQLLKEHAAEHPGTFLVVFGPGPGPEELGSYWPVNADEVGQLLFLDD